MRHHALTGNAERNKFSAPSPDFYSMMAIIARLLGIPNERAG
jgi:hypothetical protein